MAYKALYTCNVCAYEFFTNQGRGLLFDEYRCTKCDTVRRIKTMHKYLPANLYKPPTLDDIGLCLACGGVLRNDIMPMCPNCTSRNTKQKYVLISYV